MSLIKAASLSMTVIVTPWKTPVWKTHFHVDFFFNFTRINMSSFVKGHSTSAISRKPMP